MISEYEQASLRGISSDLTKGVLKEIAPQALKSFDMVEKKVFDPSYGGDLPEGVEFAAVLLQSIVEVLYAIPEETVLSATAPEEVAKPIVEEVLARTSKRGGPESEKVRTGFEAFLKKHPSMIDEIAGFFPPPLKAKGDEVDPIAHLRPGVLKIVDSQGGTSTGFVISSEGHILSADHVTRGNSEMDVAFRHRTNSRTTEEKGGTAQVIHSDQEKDIAILRISETDWPEFQDVGLASLPLSMKWQPRAWVLCFGYQENQIFADPISVEASIKPYDPILAVRFRDGGEQECLILVIPRDHPQIVPGMSGGPVLDLDTGEVIAMVTGATRQAWVKQRWRSEEIWELISAGNYGFATPLSDVAKSWPEFRKYCSQEA